MKKILLTTSFLLGLVFIMATIRYVGVQESFLKTLSGVSEVFITQAYAATATCNTPKVGDTCSFVRVGESGANYTVTGNIIGGSFNGFSCNDQIVGRNKVSEYPNSIDDGYCKDKKEGTLCALPKTGIGYNLGVCSGGTSVENQTKTSTTSTPNPTPNPTNTPTSSTTDPTQTQDKTPAYLPNPLGSNNLYDFLMVIIRMVMRWFVYPAVIAIWVWSGFAYVAAQGNPEKLSKAHSWLMWAVIVTILIFMTQGFLFALRGTVQQILPGISLQKVGSADLRIGNGTVRGETPLGPALSSKSSAVPLLEDVKSNKIASTIMDALGKAKSGCKPDADGTTYHEDPKDPKQCEPDSKCSPGYEPSDSKNCKLMDISTACPPEDGVTFNLQEDGICKPNNGGCAAGETVNSAGECLASGSSSNSDALSAYIKQCKEQDSSKTGTQCWQEYSTQSGQQTGGDTPCPDGNSRYSDGTCPSSQENVCPDGVYRYSTSVSECPGSGTTDGEEPASAGGSTKSELPEKVDTFCQQGVICSDGTCVNSSDMCSS